MDIATLFIVELSTSTSSDTTPLSSQPTSPNPYFVSLSFPHPHLKGENEAEEAVTEYNDEQFEGIDCEDLVEQLKDTESLHEQADIIHYLIMAK